MSEARYYIAGVDKHGATWFFTSVSDEWVRSYSAASFTYRRQALNFFSKIVSACLNRPTSMAQLLLKRTHCQPRDPTDTENGTEIVIHRASVSSIADRIGDLHYGER